MSIGHEMKGIAKRLTKRLWLLAFALPLHAAAETVEYFHTDALGTPVAVTDTSGNLIETSEYEPYGKLLNRPVTDGPGFTGHVQDAATGLTYMQQRYYDPLIGRFLSVDPVTANAVSGGNFNRYWYGNNNPYKFVDLDGRCTGSHLENEDGTCVSSGSFTTERSASEAQNSMSIPYRQQASTGKDVGWKASGADGDTDDPQAQDMPRIMVVAYRGVYHDQLVQKLLDGMNASGAHAVKEMEVCLIPSGPCARLDIFGRDPTGELFGVEVKTGERPSFTENQLIVYPHLSKSGTLMSTDPKMMQFLIPPGAPLPAINTWLMY